MPSSGKSSSVPRTTGWAMERRPAAADEHVVAVERDVDRPDVDLDARALLDERPQAVGERHAAGVDADERERVEIGVALDQLVSDSGERPLDCRGVEQESWPHRGRSAASSSLLLSGLAVPV